VVPNAFNVLGFFKGGSEILLGGQFRSRPDIVKVLGVRGRSEMPVDHVAHTVVGNEMMGDPLDGHAHGLLDQTVGFEAIRVNKGSNQRPLHLVGWPVWREWSWRRRGWIGMRSAVRPGVRFTGTARSSPTVLLHGPFLLAGWKWFIKLPVDQKVTQNAARTPGDPIRPPLDSRRIFFVDENAAAADQHIPLAIMRPSRNMRELAGETCFKEDKCIVSGGNVTGERRL
jgi:hypothetical protein